MAKSLGAAPPKPKNQGGSTGAHTQPPRTSGTPSKTQSTPGTGQPARLRGYANPGHGGAKGNGVANKVPR